MSVLTLTMCLLVLKSLIFESVRNIKFFLQTYNLCILNFDSHFPLFSDTHTHTHTHTQSIDLLMSFPANLSFHFLGNRGDTLGDTVHP